MSGIGPHIDKWEDERAEMADKCLNCFANYILFVPRLIFNFYSRPKVNQEPPLDYPNTIIF